MRKRSESAVKTQDTVSVGGFGGILCASGSCRHDRKASSFVHFGPAPAGCPPNAVVIVVGPP
eukprot:3158200-Amphidinium_carterae.1